MPSINSYPLSSGRKFETFLEKSKTLGVDRLAEVIPKAYFEPKVWRGLTGFFISYALYVGAIVGVAYAPHWGFYLPLYIVAGLGGWWLHCIAHDCGHNSFSRSKKFNAAIGHLALLPLLYPFYSWKHVHNLHHLHTNNLELDTDWRPIPYDMYKRMSFLQRFIYKGTRTWLFWAGTINYWLVSGFRPGFFPKKDMRTDVKRSIVFTLLASIIYFFMLFYFTGIAGFFLFFFVPWIAIHAWFSMTTLMHHTSADIPFVTSGHWTSNASRLLVTIDYRYPKWLLFLTHNISIHTAHHVAPIVPFYNLQKVQAVLKLAYPGMIREKNFSFGTLLRIIKSCHFYDPNTGYYTTATPSLSFGDRIAKAGCQIGGLLAPGLVGWILADAFSRSRSKRSRNHRVPLGAQPFEITDNADICHGYLWKNQGPVVLLVHGWGSDSSSMMGFVKPLLALGFQVASFDAPAHGASSGSKTTMTQFVKAVGAAIKSLDNVQVVISHSLGSIASIAAIADASPKHAKLIRCIVLMAAPISLSSVLERWSTNPYQLPRSVISKIYDRLHVQNGVPVSHWDISVLGKDIDTPLLVIHDEHDPVVPLAEAEKLKHSLKNVRMVQTSGLGHSRMLAAASVKTLITNFISEHPLSSISMASNND